MTVNRFTEMRQWSVELSPDLYANRSANATVYLNAMDYYKNP